MTCHKTHVRSGLTAIAAVLALSSAPLAAQEATAPPDTAAETPADPPPAADPLAPEPAATEPAAEEPAATAAPATTRRAPARTRTAATSRAPAQPVRAAAPAATAEPVAIPPAPIDPAAEPPVERLVEPAAPPVEPVAASGDLLTDETAPVAGAAGLGLLALAGLGIAVSRRRRRREELAHQQANQAYLDQHPAEPEPAAHEPGFVRVGPAAAVAASAAALPESEVRTDVPRTKLPNGFDLSRFGPHVRAAYLGPTPDNPSLSLKYRLRRAAVMDQRARQEAKTRPVEAKPAAREERVSKPAWQLHDESFMFRRAGSGERKPSRVTQH